MTVSLTDEQAKNSASSLKAIAALLEQTPTPPSTPTTPADPVPSYPNFQLIFDEYFTKDCAEGQTLTVYGDKFFFYPVGWDDTSNKGLYDTGIRHGEHADAHPRGRPRVCAPEPKINGPSAARVVAVAEVGRLAS